jgi:leader peptidase (prepilin peptidase)/N-methyltransferase
LIPIFSFIQLKGKCRKCKESISLQYPLVEALNGILYVWIAIMYVNNPDLNLLTAVLYCLLTSALIVISVVDMRTYIILPQLNIFILILGLINLVFNLGEWYTYVIGFFAISTFILILVLLNAMGDGDMKLMAVSGLLLGWKLIVLSFFIGCIVGTVVHLWLMIFKKKGRQLPFGPYLSVGIFLAMLYGEKWIEWYLRILF